MPPFCLVLWHPVQRGLGKWIGRICGDGIGFTRGHDCHSGLRVFSVFFCCCPPATETLGEIKPLEAVLESRNDVNVQVGQWRWSEASPWPPVHTVKSVALWSDAKYDTLRERLLKPAPTPSVTVGGEFITINVRAAAKALVKKQKEKEKPQKGVRTPKKATPASASAAEEEESSQVLIPKSDEVFPFPCLLCVNALAWDCLPIGG